MLRQRTIKRSVHAIGIGVHSGKKVRMALRPAGENTGILFVRTDVNSATVRARAQNVSDTTLSTSIAENGVQVATVEHLLSALWGVGIDNLVVELSSEEVPIMDGSAAPFIYLINSVGIVEQNAAKEFIRIKREIRVTQGDAIASLKPYDGFKADYTFVADHPIYNRYPKRATLDFSKVSYVEEVSRARSFGLAKELEQAQSINKCMGSSLENAVGIDDYSILNEDGLRYEDEFVKHKLLDVIGDLYLLGRPVLGRFHGYMSGHALNNKLAQALLRCEDAWEVTTLGVKQLEGREPIMQPVAG
ncbi:MAG: UDP-3-O-acyl-N-acetylglucosamine deacetylase [Gammaproteobacteria bacterium]|nr:UDP-3-O-acyl-N-acetylglucosamine deacetylase [Pseudomonadota bacterium]TDJ27242.1 MAG: UDP-3-O-acyl-N-acetylglucosamine deacetylase [Gammaproteobacteria bacterium]TDJ34112.1 MAG: UDP-3-O-acyl-N-acetylglucosamine deacetylase [Gammaproteobacteria bacterium]